MVEHSSGSKETTHDFPWKYWAYGFPLKSEIEMPEFLPYRDLSRPNPAPLDWIKITHGPSSQVPQPFIPAEVAEQNIAVQVGEDKIVLYIKQVATFCVVQGHLIQCYPAPGISNSKLRLALSGVAMAALLFQRGCFIAHGSAVSVAGQAVLFLGDSGAGKSSFAIALHQRGYPIVTDDLACILYHQGVPHLLPAYPQMRVTGETATALGLDWNSLQTLPDLPKRGFKFASEFWPQAIPLHQIFVLKPTRETTHTQRLQGHQKMMELMHHSEVMSLFSQDKTRHFMDCATLAQHVPIHYFERPMRWSQLSDVLDYFQSHWV